MDKIVCVDNLGQEEYLTIDKIYSNVGESLISYCIVISNDSEKRTFNIDRFISLYKYREQKLNLILNE